jgi:hypothetical protein
MERYSPGGAALGIAGLVIPGLLGDRDALIFFAVFLGMIAGVYLRFAFNDGRVESLRKARLRGRRGRTQQPIVSGQPIDWLSGGRYG